MQVSIPFHGHTPTLVQVCELGGSAAMQVPTRGVGAVVKQQPDTVQGASRTGSVQGRVDKVVLCSDVKQASGYLCSLAI